MRMFSTWGWTGVALLLLNEVRGILVVLSVLGAWNAAGHAQPKSQESAHAALASFLAKARD